MIGLYGDAAPWWQRLPACRACFEGSVGVPTSHSIYSDMARPAPNRSAARGRSESQVSRTPSNRGSGQRKWSPLIESPEEQFEAKKRIVITEATRAFGRKGYEATSLDDVARALNVTKAALYYYFENKQELLFECHLLAMDMGDRAYRQGVAEAAGNGLSKLRGFIVTYVQSLTSELGASAVLQEIRAMQPEHQAVILQRRRDFDHRLRALVDEGVRDGSIRACDPKLVVFWLMGAINGLPRWFDPEGTLSGQEIAEAFIDLLLRGIEPR
jgi:TetR/AcrR family transcriptional regulator